MAGLYLHIPFCRQACYYCDFHFSTVLLFKERLLRAIGRELHLQRHFLGDQPLETIYFGGGTPSLLSGSEVHALMEIIYRHFRVKSDPEITLEANPDDLSAERLRDYRNLGINRLSIGIQSFHDPHLRLLHRSHSSTAALAAYGRACDAGFGNITVDLIYGIPSADHSIWQRDLDQLFRLQPVHFSAYCLTIEPRTVLGNWTRRQKFTPADEEFAARQFEILLERAQQEGYEAYEISNFARDGRYSRHNTNYWFHRPYLGVGPGAHSYTGRTRQFNISNNYKYMQSVEAGEVPATVEPLTARDLANEYLMTSLRTVWGCDLGRLSADYGYELPAGNLARGLAEGVLVLEENRLRLSPKGRLLADALTADLFWV